MEGFLSERALYNAPGSDLQKNRHHVYIGGDGQKS